MKSLLNLLCWVDIPELHRSNLPGAARRAFARQPVASGGAIAAALLAARTLAFGAEGLTPAATAPPPAAPPRVAFAEQTHDFGQVKQGEAVNHSFIFTNMGKEILQVLSVAPGCGCTTAGAWDKEVLPGKTGSIPLQFNSGAFSGPVSKSVTVTFNDPVQSNAVLYLAGKVWTPVEVNPAGVYFMYGEDSTNSETRTVRILNNLEEPLVLEPPELASSSFKSALKTVTPGKEFALEISTSPPMPAGTVNTAVSLKTSAKEKPLLSVRVTGMGRQAVSVSPSRLLLPAKPPTSPLKLGATIHNFASAPLTLSEAGCSVPDVQVEVSELQPGRIFQLNATFPPGFTVEPARTVEILVKTSHPKYPLLKVPIQPAPRPVDAKL